MHTPAPARPDAPTLIGVGVGPGDPELLTIKALHALRRADVIVVPATEASEHGPGRAETVVLAACPDAAARLVRVPFAMRAGDGVAPGRRAAWDASARAACDAFAAGARRVVFATVGDPSVFSTFGYLAAGVKERVGTVAVEVIPGITAMQALAAASAIPLAEGSETLTLVPLTAGLDAARAALSTPGTAVFYKVGRHLPALAQAIAASGREAVVGADVGLPGERIAPLGEHRDATAGYFCTVIAAPRRSIIGGAL